MEKIYKYTSLNSAIKILESNAVALNNPQNYNDPFDSVIDFNRYSEEDLMDIAEKMLDRYLDKLKLGNRDIRLFRKIMRLSDKMPYPGELKNLIKTSVAFSDIHDGMDYFRRIYYAVYGEKPENLKVLQAQGFTVREIEILTKK